MGIQFAKIREIRVKVHIGGCFLVDRFTPIPLPNIPLTNPAGFPWVLSRLITLRLCCSTAASRVQFARICEMRLEGFSFLFQIRALCRIVISDLYG
jgi:hypothetical protein